MLFRSEKGNPGELQGYINMIAKNTIGKIKKNTEQGVFGEMKQERVSAYSGPRMKLAENKRLKPERRICMRILKAGRECMKLKLKI